MGKIELVAVPDCRRFSHQSFARVLSQRTWSECYMLSYTLPRVVVTTSSPLVAETVLCDLTSGSNEVPNVDICINKANSGAGAHRNEEG